MVFTALKSSKHFPDHGIGANSTESRDCNFERLTAKCEVSEWPKDSGKVFGSQHCPNYDLLAANVENGDLSNDSFMHHEASVDRKSEEETVNESTQCQRTQESTKEVRSNHPLVLSKQSRLLENWK